jgi:hypothetical protein
MNKHTTIEERRFLCNGDRRIVMKQCFLLELPRAYNNEDLSRLQVELRECIEPAVEDDCEEMTTRELAVAEGNLIESSGVGSWQMMEESKAFY